MNDLTQWLMCAVAWVTAAESLLTVVWGSLRVTTWGELGAAYQGLRPGFSPQEHQNSPGTTPSTCSFHSPCVGTLVFPSA